MAPVFNIYERDGSLLGDVASIAFDKVLRRRLNRPSEVSFRVPSYMVNDIQSDGRPLICAGYRTVAVTLDSTGLFFHGIIWNVQDDGDEDMIYTQVTAYDPLMIWRSRPARDDVDSYSGEAGNLSDPSFLERNKFGGPIMEEILTASESPLRVPSLAEGQLMIDLANSTFAGGGSDLSGAPTNWPMTLAEIATLLTNTGELDIVLVPIIGAVGAFGLMDLATVHTFTGNYGTDRTATVHFDYQTGDFNSRLFRRTDSMETVANKNFYFLGPRLDQQHWRSNVTGDHPDLPRPSGGDVNAPYTGGDVPGSANNLLGGLIESSRTDLGVFMNIGIYDNFGSGSGTAGSESSAYPLFLRQWQVESLLRAVPRNMVYLTPVRDQADLPAGGDVFAPGDFDIGDLVTINIGAKTRLAQTGAQRIYGYTIEIDEDGVEALGEFVASPDQDSI